MVHVLGTILACSGRIDTTRVATEIVRDLEGNGDRLLIDGLFQLNLVKSCDVNGMAH